MFNSDKKINIAIIGVGPRGAKVCEEIFKYARGLPSYHFQVLLFDPNKLGEGCHHSSQSKSLLMNTPASQLYSFESTCNTVDNKKNFDEWLAAKTDIKTQRARNSATSDYYPRYLFGEYLSDSFTSLLENCPKNLDWLHIPEAVIDIENLNKESWKLSTFNQKYEDIDYVHITTGHGTLYPNQKSKILDSSNTFIECTYPITSHLKNISAKQTIALEGLGLTSFDIVAELTEQRGGQFLTKDNGLLTYLPSGQEPRIIAFSRTGLPLRAKPKGQNNTKSISPPCFLTPFKIKSLISKAPLDFEKDVLPLIQLEMKHIYYKTLLKESYIQQEGSSYDEMENYISNLDKSINNDQRFSFDRMCRPLSKSEQGTHDNYSESLINHLKTDFFEAELGFDNSPVKAAENLLRDLREAFSQLIDFKKLAGSSHSWLYQSFLPQMKQLSIGPPRIRIAQWLALIDAGILKINLGPGTTCTYKGDKWQVTSRNWPEKKEKADIFIRSRIPIFQIESNNLIGKMITKGYATPFNNEGFKSGGIEVSPCFKIINHQGTETNSLWATGVLTEGARFYTFSLPSPGKSSRFTQDAHIAVESMFSHITQSTKLVKEAR